MGMSMQQGKKGRGKKSKGEEKEGEEREKREEEQTYSSFLVRKIFCETTVAYIRLAQPSRPVTQALSISLRRDTCFATWTGRQRQSCANRRRRLAQEAHLNLRQRGARAPFHKAGALSGRRARPKEHAPPPTPCPRSSAFCGAAILTGLRPRQTKSKQAETQTLPSDFAFCWPNTAAKVATGSSIRTWSFNFAVRELRGDCTCKPAFARSSRARVTTVLGPYFLEPSLAAWARSANEIANEPALSQHTCRPRTGIVLAVQQYSR